MLGKISASLVVVVLATQHVQAQTREEQQAACSDDVFRLCGEAVPDEQRIIACLYERRAQLSPQCRTVFNKSTRQRR